MFKPILILLLLIISACKSKTTNLSVVTKNDAIKLSDIIISIQASPTTPETIIWDGEQKNEIPDYGPNGVKFNIRYKEIFKGEFIHAKLIVNAPLKYDFIFNLNQDSSVFTQIKIEYKNQEFNGLPGNTSQRVTLR